MEEGGWKKEDGGGEESSLIYLEVTTLCHCSLTPSRTKMRFDTEEVTLNQLCRRETATTMPNTY